jgi:hypothetical protein
MSYRAQAKSDLLLERFVASLEKRSAPVKCNTDPRQIDALYAKLPARLPPLYERLVLSYRWEEVDTRFCALLANPAGPDLDGLFLEISRDPALWTQLSRSGYIQFGRGSGGDYDPVCFELKSRKKNKDCKVVRINHEEILCNNRIRIVAEVAESFEVLVLQAIKLAEKT